MLQKELRLTSISLDMVPEELKNVPNWILWQPKHNQTKLIKMPLGGKDWQTTATSFNRILEKYTVAQQQYPTGLGFTFSLDHPYICIDIDELTKENILLQESLNSYTETSPSGNGTHIFVKLLSLEHKRMVYTDFGTKKFNKTHKRDLFISSGYVTMTGDWVKDSSDTIRMMSYNELSVILHDYFNPKIINLTTVLTDLEKEENQSALMRHRHKSTVLTPEQVRLLLRKINVRTLTSNIFDLLSHPTELAILDPDCEEEARTPWLIICQAVHHNFNGGPDGLLLLHEWSKNGAKYDKKALVDVYSSFSTEPQFLNQRKPVTIASLISLVKAQQPDFSDRTPKGLPIATIQNLETYLKFYKYKLRYNIISMEVEAEMPPVVMAPLSYNTTKVEGVGLLHRIVSSELLKLNFNTNNYVSLRDSLIDYAKINTYNPVEQYFNTLDKIYNPSLNPLEDLMSTIIPSELYATPKVERALQLFIRKWLIQVAAAACTSVQYSNRIFNNVLIFTGEQGIGKTKWVASIFPEAIREYCAGSGNLQVQRFRSDSVKQAMELQGTLICNINEIDVLFKLKNYSAFKQLLDENTSKMVLPYGRATTTLTRRTVFIGSTNKTDFLVDQTGNRRITVIPADRLIYDHDVDIEQLWAHVMHWYRSGEKWWLDKNNPSELSAMAIQNQINNNNMYVGDEFFIEDLDDYFDTDARSIHYKKMSFKEVRTSVPSLLTAKTNSREFNEAKKAFITWLKQTKFGKVLPKKRATRAIQFYLVPPLRSPDKIISFRQAVESSAKEEIYVDLDPIIPVPI